MCQLFSRSPNEFIRRQNITVGLNALKTYSENKNESISNFNITPSDIIEKNHTKIFALLTFLSKKKEKPKNKEESKIRTFSMQVTPKLVFDEDNVTDSNESISSTITPNTPTIGTTISSSSNNIIGISKERPKPISEHDMTLSPFKISNKSSISKLKVSEISENEKKRSHSLDERRKISIIGNSFNDHNNNDSRNSINSNSSSMNSSTSMTLDKISTKILSIKGKDGSPKVQNLNVKNLKNDTNKLNQNTLSPMTSEYIQIEPLILSKDILKEDEEDEEFGMIYLNEIIGKVEGKFIKPNLIEDYFKIPLKSKEETINTLVNTKRKMKITHTQFDSNTKLMSNLSSSSTSSSTSSLTSTSSISSNINKENKKQRNSSQFQFISINQQMAPIEEILGKEKEEKVLKEIRNSFSNSKLFLPVIINIQNEKLKNENLKILHKCLTYPRVLYKKLPEIESNFLLNYKYFLIFERKIFVKMMKAIK